MKTFKNSKNQVLQALILKICSSCPFTKTKHVKYPIPSNGQRRR